MIVTTADWLAIGYWLVAALTSWRLFFRYLGDELCGNRWRVGPDWADVLVVSIAATLTSLMLGWIVAPFRLLFRVLAPLDPAAAARALGGESRIEKVRRRERDLKDRERRVTAMEQELGIGGGT